MLTHFWVLSLGQGCHHAREICLSARGLCNSRASCGIVFYKRFRDDCFVSRLEGRLLGMASEFPRVSVQIQFQSLPMSARASHTLRVTLMPCFPTSFLVIMPQDVSIGLQLLAVMRSFIKRKTRNQTFKFVLFPSCVCQDRASATHTDSFPLVLFSPMIESYY